MSDKQTSKIKLQIIASSGHKCWLNGKITRDNPLTGHHIIPRREKGKTTIDNIALISKSKHEAFNELERIYPKLAEEITNYLILFRGNYDLEILNRIDHIMSLVDNKEHKKKLKYRKHI